MRGCTCARRCWRAMSSAVFRNAIHFLWERDSHWSSAQQIISTGCPLSLGDSPLHLLSAGTAREFYVHCEDSPGILYPLWQSKCKGLCTCQVILLPTEPFLSPVVFLIYTEKELQEYDRFTVNNDRTAWINAEVGESCLLGDSTS